MRPESRRPRPHSRHPLFQSLDHPRGGSKRSRAIGWSNTVRAGRDRRERSPVVAAKPAGGSDYWQGLGRLRPDRRALPGFGVADPCPRDPAKYFGALSTIRKLTLRRARSQASVSPVGPAPTMKDGGMLALDHNVLLLHSTQSALPSPMNHPKPTSARLGIGDWIRTIRRHGLGVARHSPGDAPGTQLPTETPRAAPPFTWSQSSAAFVLRSFQSR